jgi:hypothetical protein
MVESLILNIYLAHLHIEECLQLSVSPHITYFLS